MELEVNCDRCKGSGEIVAGSYFDKFVCPRCIEGKVPSEEGQKLLDFMTRWGFNELSNQIESLKYKVDAANV